MQKTEAIQTVASTYNGWCNYETWAVNQWINADQGCYEQLCEIISSHSDLDDRAKELAGWVQSQYEGRYSSLWADLINNSLAEVDWYDIVEANQQ